MAADLHDGDDFHAHLSLASHELFERSGLRQEVAEFAAALPWPRSSMITSCSAGVASNQLSIRRLGTMSTCPDETGRIKIAKDKWFDAT